MFKFKLILICGLLALISTSAVQSDNISPSPKNDKNIYRYMNNSAFDRQNLSKKFRIAVVGTISSIPSDTSMEQIKPLSQLILPTHDIGYTNGYLDPFSDEGKIIPVRFSREIEDEYRKAWPSCRKMNIAVGILKLFSKLKCPTVLFGILRKHVVGVIINRQEEIYLDVEGFYIPISDEEAISTIVLGAIPYNHDEVLEGLVFIKEGKMVDFVKSIKNYAKSKKKFIDSEKKAK